MIIANIVTAILNIVALIGFYITLLSYRSTKEEIQKNLSAHLSDYQQEKPSSISVEIERIFVRENEIPTYRFKRLAPWKSFEGYTELQISVDGANFTQEEWEGIIQRANNRAKHQFEDDFHLNPNTYFNEVEGVVIAFQHMSGPENNVATIVVRATDPDILKYTIDFIIFPAAVRVYESNLSP